MTTPQPPPAGPQGPAVLEDFIEIQCPHCQGTVVLLKTDIHCGIFRHGVMIQTGEQINPHASQQECERLVASGQVRGCCKPFQFHAGMKNAEACGYI